MYGIDDDSRYKKLSGPTNMNIKAMKRLRDRIYNLDLEYRRGEKISAERLVSFDNIISDVVIRNACNTPEYFGGVRIPYLRGHGDVVCRSSQVEAVTKEVLESLRKRVRDILYFAVGERAQLYDVEHMSAWAVNKFLDQYDQPLPIPCSSADEPLKIPKADDHFSTDGMPKFMTEGRIVFWPEDVKAYNE